MASFFEPKLKTNKQSHEKHYSLTTLVVRLPNCSTVSENIKKNGTVQPQNSWDIMDCGSKLA
ncbi:hypothetical protein GXM_10099 [Nostoc sphaeroides CCNUC1]|uniref:Uncharacterized protein n=1 Tax=Nostoc sphaeroides CCNUC1 TaxID=2653204 RepID=A0A5P8WJ17_9NOSO|nr:hypothetical protein GXM_10099 [Nostoc sphaeroides CCNUC1]